MIEPRPDGEPATPPEPVNGQHPEPPKGVAMPFDVQPATMPGLDGTAWPAVQIQWGTMATLIGLPPALMAQLPQRLMAAAGAALQMVAQQPRQSGLVVASPTDIPRPGGPTFGPFPFRP